ncbi:3-hydroxybutyrate dehydrogenase [Mesorhizobium australicum]|uniref:3-hydroxybutyrate dehydrogenase n=1 Tax=Mesorhizobium australicum TaxID=536018 RepID=A0A1X7NHA9_9HYPH|nr:3-hydroxybutyrate dehydrogenase [Mesorhizobium australicum]SMH37132.1 3-hydroxybutyrate dehydrogenase [Mesorhizobium australicum]
MIERDGNSKLHGRVAIVTGSTSGIGLGIVRAFAAQGADIVINGLGDAAAIEAERAGIESEFGVRCLYSPANMLSGQEIAGMVRLAADSLGGCDILVNNAGIQHVAPIDEFPDEKWEAIVQINLVAAFHSIKAALPMMKARGWGRIINIASAHALVASPYKSAYVAAKHGIAGLTKTVALEAATAGITVNAICPGYVWTPLVEKQIPDTMAARGLTKEQVINDVLLEAQPTKEFVTVEQVAGLALFLCSDSAASMTGAILPIDGGWTAH